MIQIGGQEPAGWIYVAWHPQSPGYTKVGYSKWHPIEPCWKYKHGVKRLHRIEKHLVDFGFGPLNKWASSYHANAKKLESVIHQRLAGVRRPDVGTAREIFEIEPEEAKKIVREFIPDA